MDMEKDVIRVRDVNSEELSDLIIRAKGPKRSIRKFAEELGVNASTLTRLINLENKSPSSNELIFNIAKHADSDSGVTLEMLMEAHGIEKNSHESPMEYYRCFETRVGQVIIEELIARNYKVEMVVADSRRQCTSFDLVLESDALGERTKWAFEFKNYKTERPIIGMGYTKRWIDNIMAMFYRKDIGIEGISRVTLVVEMRAIFEQFKKILSSYRIPDEISIILISSNRIIDEYVVEKTTGKPIYVFKSEEEVE